MFLIKHCISIILSEFKFNHIGVSGDTLLSPTYEDTRVEPSLVRVGEMEVTGRGRQDEGDAEDLDSITGHSPTTQGQETVVEPAVTCPQPHKHWHGNNIFIMICDSLH